MSLMDAPEFNAARENRNKNILVGITLTIALAVVIAFAGRMLGHGWFFVNLPAEHRVSVFMQTLESGDYAKAYGIWNNDPNWQQHPDQYKDYPLSRFTEDFSTQSDWHGPVTSYHVDVSVRGTTGTAVGITVNNSRTHLFLNYERKPGTLSFFPLEIQY
jgi:hypothetical protein